MGLGQRQVADLMVEIGLALIEPFCLQSLAAPLSPGSSVPIPLTPNPSTTLPATSSLYPGALVVLGWQSPTTPSPAEVITVQSVTDDSNFVAAAVANPHLAGEQVLGPTFSTQWPTDPIFTQSEILGYIAQAQNEFLTRVPLVLALFPSQPVLLGQTYQTLPPTTIELERVAVQSNPDSATFAITSLTRAGNEVTCHLAASALADQWTPGLPIQVFGASDSSFDSASNSTFLLTTVSTDGLILTWPQTGATASATGGQVSRPILTRLYESSQETLSLNQPWWQSQGGQPPTQWAEDRAGVYGWLVMPPPQGNYWMELLASIRGSETLGLLDGFVVPDCFVPYLKYKALEYCFTKDGVQRSPSLARFCHGRFEFGVMLADRFLRNVIERTGQAGARMGG